jgi:tetratricopeptide (TPR) repeat protein
MAFIVLLLSIQAMAGADDDYQKILARGWSCKNLGDWDGAIAEFTHAIEIDKKNVEAYYQRGVVWWDCKNDSDQAISDFSKAIELNTAQPADHLL